MAFDLGAPFSSGWDLGDQSSAIFRFRGRLVVAELRASLVSWGHHFRVVGSSEAVFDNCFSVRCGMKILGQHFDAR